MKIGILTFHRAHNYGAVLQCFALQEFLKSEGHNVQVIDYRQPWIESFYSFLHLLFIKNNLKHPKAIVRHFFGFFSRVKRLKKSSIFFENFRTKYLNLSSKYLSNVFSECYDVVVIGSDQLWSTSCLGGVFDSVYMGDFFASNSPKVVGYAISSNEQSLSKIDSFMFNSVLDKFEKISFRESCLISYMKNFFHKDFQLCVDPTLLTDCSFWMNLIRKAWSQRKYIVIYQARPYSLRPQLLYEKAVEYRKNVDSNLEIVDLSNMTYEVDDFISAIKYAECVITTSFHATVFSLLMETSFYAIKLNDGHDDRYVSLLNSIDASDCCVDVDFIPQRKKCDFEHVKKRMLDLAESSKAFLRDL